MEQPVTVAVAGIPTGNGEPDDCRSHISGAPGRIRTCAHGSGGRCSIP